MLILAAHNLAALPGIAHGFFGRTAGVSTGVFDSLNCGPGSGDARPNVLENRRRVADALGAPSLVTLGQIHSALAYYYDHKAEMDAEIEEDVREADRLMAEIDKLQDVSSLKAKLIAARQEL